MHVQRFIASELEAGKGGRTVQLSHAVLRIALSQAVLWGMVPRSVAKMVRGPRHQLEERRPFSRDEQVAILDAARDEPMGLAVFLVHATGMRISEALGQRWADLDLDTVCCGCAHSSTRSVPNSWTSGPAAADAGSAAAGHRHDAA
jgi:integrase